MKNRLLEKNEITRECLKRDFLKQTIIRVDYDYLFDEYIEKVMKNVDSFLSDKGYSIKNSFMSQFGLRVDFDKLNSDLSSNIIDNINVENDKREKFISFINNDKQIKIDITKEYSSITIDYVNHVHFDELSEIFNKILTELKSVRSNLMLKRIGLRKINVYMLNNIDDIKNYFEESIFNFSSSNLDTYEFLGKNSLDMYSYKGYKVNQTFNVAQGYLQNSGTEHLVNQIILDFDIYSEKPKTDVSLDDMNNCIFELYKSSLKKEFLNDLMNENSVDERIFNI